MLPKIYRIHKKKDFENIFKKGYSQSSKIFCIRFIKNSLGYSRFAIIVSNRVACLAVTRNRVRRQIREILRLNSDIIKKSHDIVVFIQKEAIGKPYHELEKEVFFILDKIK